MNRRGGEQDTESVRKSDLRNGTKDEQTGLPVGLGHVTGTSGTLWPSDDWLHEANGEQSDPGSAVQVLLSTSSWWGINVIWHNGRMRKGLGLPSTQWQTHYGVWPKGRDPEWGNLRPGPGSGDRVGPRLQESPYGRVELSCTRVGTLVSKAFCTAKTWTYKYFQVLFPCFVKVM